MQRYKYTVHYVIDLLVTGRTQETLEILEELKGIQTKPEVIRKAV